MGASRCAKAHRNRAFGFTRYRLCPWRNTKLTTVNLTNMKKYTLQTSPFIVPTTDGKRIAEHHGLAATANSALSIAHMVAPPHWSEPFQTPEFEEYTFIISGKKQFIIEDEVVVLEAGQSIKIEKNTRVQYANPFDEPCEYIAICKPAFDFTKVHREE